MINLPLSLGKRLKLLRDEHGLTQTEVAKALGVGQSLVWRWESGKIKRLRPDKVTKLAQLYGVSEEYIATGISLGDLPYEVERWLHLPENRQMVINFYKAHILEVTQEKLDKLK